MARRAEFLRRLREILERVKQPVVPWAMEDAAAAVEADLARLETEMAEEIDDFMARRLRNRWIRARTEASDSGRRAGELLGRWGQRQGQERSA